MSRPPRFSYARALHHVTLRCNNREFLFTAPSFELFREILQEARSRFPLSVHSYCLMTNHVHLLFKVGQDDTLSKTMHWVSTVFSRKFNRASGRHGHLWEGRFRSTIVEEESYFLRCMAYVDLNPVRARIVKSPLDYRWCSHKALKDEDHAELDLHPLYFEAGPDARLRYRHYMELVNQEAQRPLVSLANEYFVGSRRFVNRMARKFGLDSDHFMVHKRLASGIEFVGPRRGGKGVTLSMPVVSS